MAVAHLMHGFIGFGKTTYARKLASELGAVRFNQDEWMIALYGHNPPQEHFRTYYNRVNGLIWQQALLFLSHGVDVVFDTGFWSRDFRDDARARLAVAGFEARFYKLECPIDLARQRCLARTAAGPDDALVIDANAFDSLLAHFTPMGTDEAYIAVPVS